MRTTLLGYHLPQPETKAHVYQDQYLPPLPQGDWSTVALYMDRGLAQEKLTATKSPGASVLAWAVPIPDTDDERGMTSEDRVGR